MSKPRLLDLFSGAGGAAMGYHRAGFEVVGVDIKPQPHYPFEFHQADALTFPLDGFDAIHASPPCQAYSTMTRKPSDHPDLYAPTRSRLVATGLPYVIENVIGAPYTHGFVLCGSMFETDKTAEWVFGNRIDAVEVVCARSPALRSHHQLIGAHADVVLFSVIAHGFHRGDVARRGVGVVKTAWMLRCL